MDAGPYLHADWLQDRSEAETAPGEGGPVTGSSAPHQRDEDERLAVGALYQAPLGADGAIVVCGPGGNSPGAFVSEGDVPWP